MLKTTRIIGTICMLALLAAAAPPAAAEPGTTETIASVTLNITCNAVRPTCEQAYGHYGTGIMRPCSERFWNTWNNGLLTPAAPAYDSAIAAGACDRLTAANVTITATRLVDGNVDEPAEPGPAELVARHVLRVICPSSTHGQPAYCDVVYGQGPSAPCEAAWNDDVWSRVPAPIGDIASALWNASRDHVVDPCDRPAADIAVDGARTADLLLFP